MPKHVWLPGEAEKVFVKHIEKLAYSRAKWEVWADLMRIFATSISNAIDKVHFDQREKEYLSTASKYSKDELNTIAECFADYVMSIDAHPFQDFLGRLYMLLELSNHWTGQFFTPYHMCKMMAQISMDGDVERQIEDKGWASVCDMCCGGGAMLIAAAEVAHEHNINFQNHILFIGQDIDPVVALMCYIQLSVTGCAGYVKIGNSLTEPMTGDPLYAPEGANIWITPMYASRVWDMRRKVRLMDSLFSAAPIEHPDKEQQAQAQPQDMIIDLLGDPISTDRSISVGTGKRRVTHGRKMPEQQTYETISLFDLER